MKNKDSDKIKTLEDEVNRLKNREAELMRENLALGAALGNAIKFIEMMAEEFVDTLPRTSASFYQVANSLLKQKC